MADTETKELSLVEAQFSLVPRNLTEAMEFSKLIASTSLVPKSYRDKDGKVNPGDILIAVQLGLEVGLKPLQAIQNIAVINGQPTMWGDAIRGLCEASGLLEYCNETWDEKTKTATCKVKRKGKPEHVQTFSMADAVQAGLAEKETYKKYPKRMCGARARGWAFRNEFSDVLKGLQSREEVEDYEVIGESAEGHILTRPRRKSEASVSETIPTVVPAAEISEQVEKFQAEVGQSKAANAVPPPIDRSKLIKVMIHDSVQKTGGGKTFYVLSFEGTSGGKLEASTFDQKQHEFALTCKGSFALIDTKKVQKGDKTYTNLLHIEKAPEETDAPPDEPGSNG